MTKKSVVSEIKTHEEFKKQMHHLSTVIQSRTNMANSMGESFNGNRTLWDDCGYDQTLTFEKFSERYLRQDICKRIINAYPQATWATAPTIYETEDKEVTAFEETIEEFTRNTKIYHYINRADILACIGQYSVLVLGFNDGTDMSKPVKKASELLYSHPYSEANAKIIEVDTNKNSRRFGKPLMYEISISDSTNNTSTGVASQVVQSIPNSTFKVHFSRIIHVVVEPLENDTHGIPMLQSVFNRLQDLEKVIACSSEMYWRGAFPGMAFEAREGTSISPQDMDNLEEEIEQYINSLSRYLRVQGIDVKSLAPQIVSPKEQIDGLIGLISATEGIPKRILLGSEEAKLAGSQDQVNWNERVSERRKLFATPFVIRPLIDRLIEVGVLPTPKNNRYEVSWPKVNSPTEVQIAETAKIQSEALAKYTESGSDMIIPPYSFLTEIMKFSDEKAEAILKTAMLSEDQDELIFDKPVETIKEKGEARFGNGEDESIQKDKVQDTVTRKDTQSKEKVQSKK